MSGLGARDMFGSVHPTRHYYNAGILLEGGCNEDELASPNAIRIATFLSSTNVHGELRLGRIHR
jgi:hypothetical protein